MGTKYEEEEIYVEGAGFPSYVIIKRKELDRYKRLGFKFVDLPVKRDKHLVEAKAKYINNEAKEQSNEYEKCIEDGIIKEYGGPKDSS